MPKTFSNTADPTTVVHDPCNRSASSLGHSVDSMARVYGAHREFHSQDIKSNQCHVSARNYELRNWMREHMKSSVDMQRLLSDHETLRIVEDPIFFLRHFGEMIQSSIDREIDDQDFTAQSLDNLPLDFSSPPKEANTPFCKFDSIFLKRIENWHGPTKLFQAHSSEDRVHQKCTHSEAEASSPLIDQYSPSATSIDEATQTTLPAVDCRKSPDDHEHTRQQFRIRNERRRRRLQKSKQIRMQDTSTASLSSSDESVEPAAAAVVDITTHSRLPSSSVDTSRPSTSPSPTGSQFISPQPSPASSSISISPYLSPLTQSTPKSSPQYGWARRKGDMRARKQQPSMSSKLKEQLRGRAEKLTRRRKDSSEGETPDGGKALPIPIKSSTIPSPSIQYGKSPRLHSIRTSPFFLCQPSSPLSGGEMPTLDLSGDGAASATKYKSPRLHSLRRSTSLSSSKQFSSSTHSVPSLRLTASRCKPCVGSSAATDISSRTFFYLPESDSADTSSTSSAPLYRLSTVSSMQMPTSLSILSSNQCIKQSDATPESPANVCMGTQNCIEYTTWRGKVLSDTFSASSAEGDSDPTPEKFKPEAFTQCFPSTNPIKCSPEVLNVTSGDDSTSPHLHGKSCGWVDDGGKKSSSTSNDSIPDGHEDTEKTTRRSQKRERESIDITNSPDTCNKRHRPPLGEIRRKFGTGQSNGRVPTSRSGRRSRKTTVLSGDQIKEKNARQATMFKEARARLEQRLLSNNRGAAVQDQPKGKLPPWFRDESAESPYTLQERRAAMELVINNKDNLLRSLCLPHSTMYSLDGKAPLSVPN